MTNVKFLQIINFLMEDNGIKLDIDKNLLETRYKKAKSYLDDWNRLIENKDLFESDDDYFKLYDDEDKLNLKKIKDRICYKSSWRIGDEDPKNDDGEPITIAVGFMCDFMLDKSVELNTSIEDNFCCRCHPNCLFSYEEDFTLKEDIKQYTWIHFKCALHSVDNIHAAVDKNHLISLSNMKKIFDNYVAFCEYALYGDDYDDKE